MDPSQIAGLLKSYGAADTPENQNRLRQHYASDPTAADRRMVGAQGQSDESGGSRDAMLNAMLDKFVAQTSAPAVQPEVLPVSPMVQNASAPTMRSATAGIPPAIQQREQYGPGGGDPLQREVNRNTPAMPNARPPTMPKTSGYEVDPQTSAMPVTGTPDFSMMDLLAPIIGILGAGAVAKPAYNAVGKRIAPSTQQGPEATYAGPMNKNIVPGGDKVVGKTERLGSNVVEKGTSAGTPALESPAVPLDNRAPSTVTGSPENEVLARKAQTQAELDAANNEGNAIMKQMAKGKTFQPKGAVRNVTGRK